uniref:Solute carrier family 25 member 28 n=1 Tax=Oryzias sinensis TaxID=183150 RepID=A0A8C7XQV3_9TELE
MATVLHDAIMNPAEGKHASTLCSLKAFKQIKEESVLQTSWNLQRLQMFNSPYRGVLDCMGALLRREGPASFYRSYTTQLTMNVPFQALHFMTYEYLQELLNPHRQYNPSSHVVSGALAGAVAAAATTPLDVCKTLLNTQEAAGGAVGAAARIIYQMPSTAISWSVYEFFKYVLTKRRHQRRLRGDGDR